MAKRPITIHNVCFTTPDQHVHVKPGDEVRWHAEPSATYTLHIAGGFFEGEPNSFRIPMDPTGWTGDYVVAGPPGDRLTAYIYDASGNNCLKEGDGPPDIIIDSTAGNDPKKAGPSKKKVPTKGKK